MKKLIFCCLCIFALMACGERNNITGRWAMEVDDAGTTFIKMPDDSIASPELRFEYDTIYMDVHSSTGTVKSQCLGIYSIEGEEIKITDSYGKQRICKFTLKDNILTVSEQDKPDVVIMRLRRIKEEE